MGAPLFEIALHEIRILLRTRRALAMAGLYVGGGLLAGLGYALSVHWIERRLPGMIAEQTGQSDAGVRALALVAEPAYRRMLSFLAGVPLERLEPSLVESPILPFILWGALLALPFWVVVTSFDQLASDLESHALRYSTLRTSRGTLLLGKLLGHLGLVWGLTGLGGLALLILGSVWIESADLLASLPGFGRIWLLLGPFAFTYLAICCFSSVSLGRPFVALMASLGWVLVLRALSWLRFLSDEGPAAALRLLHQLSPSMHEAGFWEAGLAGPLLSVSAYLLVGGLFLAGALIWLERRSL